MIVDPRPRKEKLYAGRDTRESVSAKSNFDSGRCSGKERERQGIGGTLRGVSRDPRRASWESRRCEQVSITYGNERSEIGGIIAVQALDLSAHNDIDHRLLEADFFGDDNAALRARGVYLHPHRHLQAIH